MKKIPGFFAIFLAALLLALPSAAALQKASIPEIEMSVELPDGWMVFTRDTKADDPNYGSLGTDKTALDEKLQKQNAYLCAVKAGGSKAPQILVTMIENEETKKIYDLNTLPDNDLVKYGEKMRDGEEMKNTGTAVTDISVYKQKECRFLKLQFHRKTGTGEWYGTEYITFVNGRSVTVALHASAKEAAAELENTLQQVVDSIHFTEIKPQPVTDSPVAIGILEALGIAIVGGSIIGYRARSRRKKAEAEAEKALEERKRSRNGGGMDI
jgi:hypothetical protein